MKLMLILHSGAAKAERPFELCLEENFHAPDGHLAYSVNNRPGLADCAEIAPGVYSFLIGGRSYEAHVVPRWGGKGEADRYVVTVGTRDYLLEVRDPRRRRHGGHAAAVEGPQEIRAPMPGTIVKILVSENQEVGQGTGLLVMEAMKMQNELRAPRPGRVERIYAVEGRGVETGAPLLRLV
jgi:biotin carboxyl carrier protein